MAKTTGLGSKLQVADASSTLQDLSDDVTNYNFATPRGVQDVTGLGKSANERLLLLADFSISLSGVFNSAANQSHDVFKTVPSTSVARSTVIQPTSSSTPSLTVNCLYSDYQVTRNNTGELTWQAPGALADGAVPTWA